MKCYHVKFMADDLELLGEAWFNVVVYSQLISNLDAVAKETLTATEYSKWSHFECEITGI